jgi:hypothetical protein
MRRLAIRLSLPSMHAVILAAATAHAHSANCQRYFYM